MASIFLVFAPGLSYGLSKHSDDFTPFFRLWKTITKSLGKNWKVWGNILEPEIWWISVPSFIEIVQRVKKLNSISRARMNFRRRPILCTTLYRNPMQVSKFGGAFDQLFLWFVFMEFSQKMPLSFFYTMVQKSQKWPKTQIKGVLWSPQAYGRAGQ